MRAAVVIATGALLGGMLALCAGEAEAHKPQKHAKKSVAHHRYRVVNRVPQSRQHDSYVEMLADKIPRGTLDWWNQMQREGRLGGETP